MVTYVFATLSDKVNIWKYRLSHHINNIFYEIIMVHKLFIRLKLAGISIPTISKTLAQWLWKTIFMILMKVLKNGKEKPEEKSTMEMSTKSSLKSGR